MGRLTNMFPNMGRETIVRALQRRYVICHVVRLQTDEAVITILPKLSRHYFRKDRKFACLGCSCMIHEVCR